MDNDGIVRVVIIGCGDRGMIYGREAHSRKGQFKIVGIAEPDDARRAAAAAAFGLPPERCLTCADDVARKPKFADAVLNCTMDALHVETSLPLLRKGYDMLLEKPIAPTREGAKRRLVRHLPRPADVPCDRRARQRDRLLRAHPGR